MKYIVLLSLLFGACVHASQQDFAKKHCVTKKDAFKVPYLPQRKNVSQKFCVVADKKVIAKDLVIYIGEALKRRQQLAKARRFATQRKIVEQDRYVAHILATMSDNQ